MKLYLVPTPVGNLEDMTFRSVRILEEVDLILAEDTRTSGKLLKHYQISTQMISHHMHNEHKTVETILSKLNSGETIALISDAGTPAISDPGFLLTRACVQNNIQHIGHHSHPINSGTHTCWDKNRPTHSNRGKNSTVHLQHTTGYLQSRI